MSSQPRLQLLQEENHNRLSFAISHIFRKMYCAFAVSPSTMVNSLFPFSMCQITSSLVFIRLQLLQDDSQKAFCCARCRFRKGGAFFLSWNEISCYFRKCIVPFNNGDTDVFVSIFDIIFISCKFS